MTASQKPVFALSTTTIAPPLGRPSLGFSKNPEATFTAMWSSPRTQALLMSTSPWCSATSMCMTGGISTLPSEIHVNASSIARRHCASNPTAGAQLRLRQYEHRHSFPSPSAAHVKRARVPSSSNRVASRMRV